MVYKKDEGSKFSIDVIAVIKVLRFLVNECLLYTIGSGLLLLNNIIRTIGGHFVTVVSLDDNQLLITKS